VWADVLLLLLLLLLSVVLVVVVVVVLSLVHVLLRRHGQDVVLIRHGHP
jgi:hypothetical protein